MVERRYFCRLQDQREVWLYRIINTWGEYIELLDYGATLYSLCVRDRSGSLKDVVLGPAVPSELETCPYMGSVIGRCANRIAYGHFYLNGAECHLEQNQNGHHLHGASGNYARQLFELWEIQENRLRFHLEDTGKGGFDNRAQVFVEYGFDDQGRLEICYEITPEEDTILSPTSHAYFNLTGGDVRSHMLWIPSVRAAKKGRSGMPEGEVWDVRGSAWDFTTPRMIGEALSAGHDGEFAKQPRRFDDCYLLENGRSMAAQLYAPQTGIRLRVFTDMPSLILFTPVAAQAVRGKRGAVYDGYCAVCLETQYVPNAINCKSFKQPVFRAGEALRSRTVYEFSVVQAQLQEEVI
ncbi:MAG: galactose mutarotase [Enterocloster asparagiformis]|nr:galactose mutarotase [Enterocloster asparagiformis]